MTKAITLSLLLASFPAFAATVTHNGSFLNDPGSYPKVFNSSVPQFNPALGTLTSVSLTIGSASSARVEFESETPATGNINSSLLGAVSGSFGSLSTAVIFNTSIGPVAIGADDEAGIPDFAGVDYHDFGLLSDADSDADSLSSGLGAYIGGGTVSLTINDNQSWSASGVGDLSINTRPREASTTATEPVRPYARCTPSCAFSG